MPLQGLDSISNSCFVRGNGNAANGTPPFLFPAWNHLGFFVSEKPVAASEQTPTVNSPSSEIMVGKSAG